MVAALHRFAGCISDATDEQISKRAERWLGEMIEQQRNPVAGNAYQTGCKRWRACDVMLMLWLVDPVLDVSHNIVPTTNNVTAIAKPLFLRMGTSAPISR